MCTFFSYISDRLNLVFDIYLLMHKKMSMVLGYCQLGGGRKAVSFIDNTIVYEIYKNINIFYAFYEINFIYVMI